jgi:archaellum component FlaC
VSITSATNQPLEGAILKISVKHRRFKSPPSPDELRKDSEDLLQAMAILDGVKSQLKLAAAELGGLEAKLSQARAELERLEDMRRQILAGMG